MSGSDDNSKAGTKAIPDRASVFLRSVEDDGTENVKKAISLITKTTVLHVHYAFLYISLPSLHARLRRENA